MLCEHTPALAFTLSFTSDGGNLLRSVSWMTPSSSDYCFSSDPTFWKVTPPAHPPTRCQGPRLPTCPLPPVTQSQKKKKYTVAVSCVERGGGCVCGGQVEACRCCKGSVSGGLSQQGKKQVRCTLLDSLKVEVPRGGGATPQTH